LTDPMTIAACVVGGATGVGLLGWWLQRRGQARRHAQVDARSIKLGHREPPSLHPKIDEHKCICTGACITVCPEKDVLGMIDGRPKLIKPSACVGHGECLRACPVDAITLVIGSERRGVDLPMLQADFQTNVPRLYIAGELGGMGLIHNAINQGVQAVRGMSPSSGDDALDLLVVGAGPAGLAAALEAHARGLRYLLVEQDSLGGALRSYPRQKIVMTHPVELPLHGRVQLRRTTKEALLELWEQIASTHALQLATGEQVRDLQRDEAGVFTVTTSRASHRARHVLLAIGRRGTPRKLGIPGEELDKVTYRLLEPEQYRERRCMVVGGGDAAIETALMLAAEPGARITLVHRGRAFDRCKPDNHDALEAARDAGKLDVLTEAAPVAIAIDEVRVAHGGVERTIDNDFVFVCIGGELPTAWLGKVGVEVRTFRGEAHPAAGSA
jgi:thioredoxin reductase (NADPH)